MYKWLLVGIILLGLYAWRADFSRYSIFTVGVFKRVTRSPVESEEECEEYYCENTVSPGEKRRSFKEIVVAGIVVVQYGGGTHHYCPDHASFEASEGIDETPGTIVERLSHPAAKLIIALDKRTPETVDEANARDAPRNIASTTSDVVSLAPVIIIVLIASAMMRLMRPVTTE